MLVHQRVCFTSKSHMFPLRIFAAPQDGPRRDHRDVLPRRPLRRRRGGGRRCGGDVVQGGHQEPTAMEEFDGDNTWIFDGFSCLFPCLFCGFYDVLCSFDVVLYVVLYVLLYAVFCAPRPFFLEDIVCSFGVVRILGWEIHISKYLERSARHGRSSGKNAQWCPVSLAS